MKGQTQAVTAVMITGIMVGTLAAVYVWGTPLLEKRESQTQVEQVENDVIGLKEEIGSVSNAGENSGSEVTIRLEDGRVQVNEDENYIEVTSFADTSRYPQGTWRLLDGNNLQGLSFASGGYGIIGQDSAGVVAVRSTGDSGRIRYRIEFRNLLDERFEGTQVEQVDLQASGAEESTEETTVSLVNKGSELDENGFELQTGENVDHVRTVVEVSLQ
jgi:hypothetical protein